MVRLQSKRYQNVFYEYDPETSSFEMDAYGNCFRGVDPKGKPVLIHEIIGNEDCPEYLLYHFLYAPHPRFDKSKIIPIIEMIPEYDDVKPSSPFFSKSETNVTILRLFLIEEDFAGVSLADVIQQKNSNKTFDSTAFVELRGLCYANRVAFAKRVTIEILKCISHLHSYGICVSFVDPQSIVIGEDGNVKIRELNSTLYKLTQSFRGAIPSDLGVRFLPLSFCSPEVILRDRHYVIDQRSDIYSIGMLMSYILTGHAPFVGKTVEIMAQQIKGRISLKEIDDVHLRSVIKKATQKDPLRRYQSVNDFMVALMFDRVQSPAWYDRLLMAISNVFRLKKNICVSLSIFILFIIFICPSIAAQNTMRVHYTNGAKGDIPIAQIDSITFVNMESGEGENVQVKELTGSWLWGSVEQGYYEVLTFNDDHTYTGYDNYFVYGFDTWTYGWYAQLGAMLTLQSNGYGYQRRYNWFVKALTENALEVMTKMGLFTYYRLQPEVIKLQIGSEPLSCEEGDSFVFADGVIAAIEDNKLKGIAKGTTYVQKYNATSNTILSYKVIVE